MIEPDDPGLFMRYPAFDDLIPPPQLAEGYTLRTYQPGDDAALATLLARAFGPEWDERRVREVLVDAPDVKEIYVVEYAGTLVATASARVLSEEFPDVGYLHWVASDPDHRGRQLALAVVQRVLDYLRNINAQNALLETQDWRESAIRLYTRIGFVPEYRGTRAQLRWSRILRKLVH